MSSEKAPSTVTATTTPVEGGDDSSNLSKNALKKKLKAEKAAAAKAAKAKAKVSKLTREWNRKTLEETERAVYI